MQNTTADIFGIGPKVKISSYLQCFTYIEINCSVSEISAGTAREKRK
jgi:hypothetical protein